MLRKRSLAKKYLVAGFSLLEVLIASVILSVIGVAYIHVSGTYNTSVQDVQEVSMAERMMLTMVNEVLATAHLYPGLPTSIYDERKVSLELSGTGVDRQGKSSPDLFLANFMRNKCNYRYFAYRCYNFQGGLEFSCAVKYKEDKTPETDESFAIHAERYMPVACRDKIGDEVSPEAFPENDPYLGTNNRNSYYTCYGPAGDPVLESPATCTKMSVWFFKSAVHDLSMVRDLANQQDIDVLSPLPMFRMNFHIAYARAINEKETHLFFSRLVTEVSAH